MVHKSMVSVQKNRNKDRYSSQAALAAENAVGDETWAPGGVLALEEKK